MKYFAEATFTSFQICFQNHASEMWAQGVPDFPDDASTLLHPSVALNEQSQEFQPRKKTGPETAFLVGEMFLSRRNALDNRFETKRGLGSSSKKPFTVRCFSFTFRQQEIL